jgi:hypothetical protein
MTPSTIVARERPRSAAGRRRTRTVIVGLVAVLAAGTAGGCTGSDAASRPHAAPVGEIPQPTSADLKAAGFEALPLAPDGDRVDIAEPTFSDPTAITNPLFPISDLDSVVFSGEVEGKPFHTETTLLPQTRVIEWTDGMQVETRISQYFAYLDGRIEEVALDYYAQADDGSVWYFGEDLWDFDDEGFVDSTEGNWLAGVDGPPAMIMPGDPQVGDVHRAENTPPVAFEEVEITSIDETFDGPAGPVEGGLVATELHLDGTTSDKNFAPGYGEFFSNHDGHVEALALAVPTDALDNDVPAELAALSTGADDLFDPVRRGDWTAASTVLGATATAWATFSQGDVPPYLATEMSRAIEDAAAAIDAQDPAAAGTAAIDVAQSAADLRLRHVPPAEIDLARFDLWARQTIVDAAAGDRGGVRGDVTTLEFVRDRFAHTLDQPDVIRIDNHLIEMRNTVNDDDLPAAGAEADGLRATLAAIEPAT